MILIGKSMSLYIILAQRLMAQKPTFLQNKLDVVVFFCSTGVFETRVTQEPDWAMRLTEEELFLFDSNKEVVQPAHFWRRYLIPIVMAASPNSECTEWAQNMAVTKWYMRPMLLKEFLIAAQFQSAKMNETALEHFYTKYGPNARRAYHRCNDPDGLDAHVQDVRSKLHGETLRSVITEYSAADGNHDSVSHSVMLITAGPMRSSFRSGFISHDVFQLAREKYKSDKDQKIIHLFLLLNSQRTTRASAGYIFEDSMHRILKKGA
ncbi:hypothetical protein K435DRAFT_706371, partial [Dendrothele bispora CBS 962.96]